MRSSPVFSFRGRIWLGVSSFLPIASRLLITVFLAWCYMPANAACPDITTANGSIVYSGSNVSYTASGPLQLFGCWLSPDGLATIQDIAATNGNYWIGYSGSAYLPEGTWTDPSGTWATFPFAISLNNNLLIRGIVTLTPLDHSTSGWAAGAVEPFFVATSQHMDTRLLVLLK